VRTHEGQDVLCVDGARVIAPEEGTVEYDTSLLGGRVARLHRTDGSYWYFAHLSGWNADAHPSGTRVHTGYCGDTGNATTPHVHFGHYDPDGDAIDPMSSLVSWLRQAEDDLDELLPAGSGTLLRRTADPTEISASAASRPASGAREASGQPLDRGDRGAGRSGAFELTVVWSAGLMLAMVRTAARRAKRRAGPRRRRAVRRIGALRQAPAVVVHVLGRAASM
jgi:hypothetical protein